MLLSVFERLLLLNMFSDESDITTMKVVRQIKDKLGFTEDEVAKLNFQKQEGGGIQWQQDAVEAKEFDLSGRAMVLIPKIFKELSSKKKISMPMLLLYERFEEKE
jgi:hypothetical protein